MIKVLLYHNNPILAAGIETILSESEGITIRQKVTTEELLWQVLGKNGELPSCLLMIITGQTSLITVILDRLRRYHGDLPVVIMSIFESVEYVTQLLKSGVSGVINYDAGLEDLVQAILKVAGGERYVSYQLAEKLAMHYVEYSTEKPHEILSRREFEVFVQLGNGYTVSEIAGKFRISPKTVSTHKVRIMKKMKMKSTSDIVKYMVKCK